MTAHVEPRIEKFEKILKTRLFYVPGWSHSLTSCNSRIGSGRQLFYWHAWNWTSDYTYFLLVLKIVNVFHWSMWPGKKIVLFQSSLYFFFSSLLIQHFHLIEVFTEFWQNREDTRKRFCGKSAMNQIWRRRKFIERSNDESPIKIKKQQHLRNLELGI